jgi:hypothetical protein
MVTDPNLDWYKSISAQLGLMPRCSFASVHRCPRYYQSLSLLKYTGATAISEKEDKALLAKWQKHELWPKIAEQETSIFGSSERQQLSHFCPEVMYDRFGVFATYIADYADEIDRDNAYRRLRSINAAKSDWRWQWASLMEQHYSDCPLYSVLATSADHMAAQSSKPIGERILDKLKKHPVISILTTIAAVLIGFSSLTEAGKQLWDFIFSLFRR